MMNRPTYALIIHATREASDDFEAIEGKAYDAALALLVKAGFTLHDASCLSRSPKAIYHATRKAVDE